jgi:threonine dehydratase
MVVVLAPGVERFRNTPQFVDGQLAAALGRDVLVKIETLNAIGSFKARGASLLAPELDPEDTWVCSTAGNFGRHSHTSPASTERGSTCSSLPTSRRPDVPTSRR